MKRFTIVLLIAVLAVSGLFAGISGYLQAKYEINFDKGDFQYTSPKKNAGDLDFSVIFENQFGKTNNDGKVYADAAASLRWISKSKTKKDGSRFTLSELGYFEIGIDRMMIVGPEWTWNFLEAEKVGGYADSTLDFHTWYRHDHMKASGFNDGEIITLTSDLDWGGDFDIDLKLKDDYEKYQKKVAYGVSYGFYNSDDEDNKMHGTTFNYKGYKLALAANGYTDQFDNTYVQKHNYYLGFETPEYDINGIRVQGAVGGSYRANSEHNDEWVAGLSAKAAYATEKFSLKFATDQTVKTWGLNEKDNHDEYPLYNADYLLQGEFAPVSVDIFFATEGKSDKGSDDNYALILDGDHDMWKSPDENKKYYFSEQGIYGGDGNSVRDLLSAELRGDLNKFDIPVKLTVQGLNVLHDSRIINVLAESTLLDGGLKLSVYGKDLLASFSKVNGTKDGNWTDGESCYADGSGSYFYWAENGNFQKIGVDAEYLLNDAITLNGGLYAKLGIKDLGGELGATYRADLFTATGFVKADFAFFGDDYADLVGAKAKDYSRLQMGAKAVSDKLVNGAELSIEYKSGNLLNTMYEYDWCLGKVAGSLTTKCKVTF